MKSGLLNSKLVTALFCSVFVASFFQGVYADEVPTEVVHMKNLIQQIVTDPAYPKTLFPNTSIDGDLLYLNSYRELLKEAKEHEHLLVQHWDHLATGDDAELVLVSALQPATGSAYLEAGSHLLQRYKAGKINKDIFKLAYLLTSSNKQWFWTFNFQDQRVRSFLIEVKGTLSDDKNISHWVDDVLSGRLKDRDVFLRNESPSLASQKIDILDDKSGKDSASVDARDESTDKNKTNERVNTARLEIQASDSRWPIGLLVAMAILAILYWWRSK